MPIDPSMNILHRRSPQLEKIFHPQTVAIVGATETEGSVGRTLMQNLSSFQGEAIPINPKRETVLGVKAYPSLKKVGKEIDLVVVVVPSKVVPSIVQEAADLGIPAMIIISAGFKEMGESGALLEEKILKIARDAKMRIIGPNCLGVMNPLAQFNATFAKGMALKGNIAFISQSGALCTAVLDWSLDHQVGFSGFVSIGSMMDVDWGDLIDHFGNDPATKSILIYMESIGNPRDFLSAAREVSLSKPIILIKAGRSEESAKAAASHTGSLAGSDAVLSAALDRVGVLRVDTISDLFSMADVLAKQPKPKGPHLMIVTNAGGPGVIATDALIAEGGKLAELSQEALQELNGFLPDAWSHGNPIDILGDADAKKYAEAVQVVAKDKKADGVLVILTPQDMTDPKGTASALESLAKTDKPILASWMGAKAVEEGKKILAQKGIPQFEFPDEASKTFSKTWQYSQNLKDIYETPAPSFFCQIKSKQAEDILKKAKKEGRALLDEIESKKLLSAYDIPCTPMELAKTAEEAVFFAKQMGFPVVLKIHSKIITHKTDVGGVKLNLHTEEEVKQAYLEIFESVKKHAGEKAFDGVSVQPMIRLDGSYELILGSSIDEQFGPVLLFGSGGQLVEVYKDSSLALPPLTTTLARRMMEKTKIYEALQGVRGRKSIDLKKLEQILVQFSQLITDYPEIKECDINPLLVSEKKMIALDARVLLHKTSSFPKPSIRPYPSQYIEAWSLADQTPITIRPIRADDEPLMIQFHQDLSQETVRLRYLKAIQYEERVAHERLLKICFNDYDREITLLAEKEQEVLAVVRLSKISGTSEAFFSLIVKDQWQNRGIGKKLMSKMLLIAKEEQITQVQACMLLENTPMQKLCKNLGFHLRSDESYVFVEKKIP